MKNNSKLTKLLNVCWNHVLFILFRSSYFQQMLNNFVNFDFLFTKLSGIDPCEKRINIPGGHAWQHFLWLVANLNQWPIYLVKQACGNDKMACVYLVLQCTLQHFDNLYIPIFSSQILLYDHISHFSRLNKAVSVLCTTLDLQKHHRSKYFWREYSYFHAPVFKQGLLQFSFFCMNVSLIMYLVKTQVH